ncbi:copper homeostasis membrane protein CopD [Hyphomicrobium sp.]|uniref:copper homeostasis membrane protein CopD n=1 Tax=Hyphomicrobium sp. TaxID=82 RepID=UPI001D65FAAD|nr:copper homeostasis membrane protein CopD [Hyphomicrobium sp.]MBY0560266.1 copper homeostasis membrane protein CopD [Hyphomicrobium sp.]
MDATLIFWRVLHFAATAQAVGVVFFASLVLRGLERQYPLRQLSSLFWISMAVALASGAAWFCAVTSAIADAPWTTAIADGTAGTLLADTQFGRVWLFRFAAGVLLTAVTLLWKAESREALIARNLQSILFIGGLAFAGHAGSTPRPKGEVHLASDLLHLIAVGAWVGGLLPFALCLQAPPKEASPHSVDVIREITRRFSNLGVAAVLVIAATGLVNTWNLVGSVELLKTTEYGRLLLIKIAVFLSMVIVAAINRFALAPNLTEPQTIQAIRRNALIETAFGLIILSIVAALGTMPPALMDHSAMHHS